MLVKEVAGVGDHFASGSVRAIDSAVRMPARASRPTECACDGGEVPVGLYQDLTAIIGALFLRETPNKLSTVNYNGIWTNSFLTEVQWAKKEFSFINSGGRFTDRIHGTWVQDSQTGGRAFAPAGPDVSDDERRRCEQGEYLACNGNDKGRCIEPHGLYRGKEDRSVVHGHLQKKGKPGSW